MTQVCPSCLSSLSRLAWTCSRGDDRGKREREKAILVLQVLFQTLLVSSLLTSRWSNQVTWLPPDSSWEGSKRLHDKNMILRRGEDLVIFAVYQDLFKYWDAMIGLIFNWIILLSTFNLHCALYKHTHTHNLQETGPRHSCVKWKWKKTEQSSIFSQTLFSTLAFL